MNKTDILQHLDAPGEASHTLYIRWGTSRGRDTYGYTTCTLSEHGHKVAGCNGGGYDLRGTVFGNWLAATYRDRLLKLKAKNMPRHTRWNADECAYICYECSQSRAERVTARTEKWDSPRPICPHCGEPMERDRRAGEKINEGHYLYGLTFHDPDYDPSKAVIGKDCADRTLGDGAEGKTVGQAEQAGESFGLERYQAVYSASSKVPTKRHTVPSIDGACGFDSVRAIAEAIGLKVRLLPAGKRMDIIEVSEAA